MTLTGQTVHFPAGTADPEDPAYDPTVNQIIIPFHVLEDSFIEGQEAIDIQIDSYSSSTGKIYPQSDW